jgi:hypothetical protein
MGLTKGDALIEVTKETRKRLKMQALLENCTMKDYVTKLSKQHEAQV